MSCSEPEGGQEYDTADQSTTVEAAGLTTNGSIEPNPQETNLADEVGDAESTFSTNLSSSELTITNLLTSHSTSVQLDDLTKADIPLRFIITEEQPDQYAADGVTGTLVPIEDEVGENVAAPVAGQSRVGRIPHEASKIVVSSYQVQTLNAEGSLVPSIIHNIPMDTIIDANTSVQIVKNAPGQQQVKADLTKASVVSNMDVPMTLTFTPIASKTALHGSDIDEITANVQHQVATPKRKARLVTDNSAGVKKTIMEMLPNVDMGHIMKLPVVTLPTNAAATKSTQQISMSDPNSVATTLFTSADGSVASSSFVISQQPSLRKNAPTILGPPITKDTVLYPIDIQKLSKLSKMSGKSPLVFAGGQKPTYISANILSMIAPDAKKSELQQVISPGVSGEEVGILTNQQGQQFSSDEFAVEIIEQVSNEMKAQLGDEQGVVSFGESINTVGSQIPEDNMQQYRTIVPKPQLIKKLRNQLKSPSHSRSYSPGGSRTRLRPWLEHLLDAEAIEGLNWVDREERIFRIPWKHASEGSWHAEDSVVFREYAIHSGKHPQNYPTTPQLHTKWKANFRCALNSLSDIVLLREISNPRGQKAYRIYKFLEHKPKKDPGKKRDSFTYVKGSNGDVNREQADDLSTFTSQDAGELLVALKHGAKNLNLPADFNIGSSLAHGVKLVNRAGGEVVVSIDAETGQQRDVVFPQFHKIGDEYGGPGELIEVSKEVVIPMEGSADDSDEMDSVRQSLPSEKDIKDLIARATKAAQKRRSGLKGAAGRGAAKDCDFTAADQAGEVGVAENAIDVIKSEIFFLNTLPEAVSPLALKLAATSLEADGGETSLAWQPKSQFLFKFESIAGTELWTALLWCVICGECFTSLSSLRRHVSVHQEKRLWIDEQLTPAGSAAATNSDCLVCGLRFAKTTSMMKHLLQHSSSFTAAAARSSDSDTDLKCPPCVVCAKPFINLDKLTCHQLSHSCPVCHATAADIDKHVGKCHTAGGLYQCYVCGQYASSLQHMLYHQHEAHLGVYSIDLHNRARQSWIAYCSHCHHLVRAHTGKDKDTTCEECARHHCSGCGRSFKSYLFFLMHTLKEDHDGECVVCAYKRILETRHVSSFYRRSGPVDGQDSSTLHQFADVALGEHIIESGTPAGRGADSESDTPATKTVGGRKRSLKGGKAMKHELEEIDLSALRCAEISTEPNEFSSSPVQYGEVFILQQNAEDTDWMTVENTIVAESPAKRDGPSGKNSSDSERSPRKVPRILATKRRTAARTARAADKKPKVVEENNVLECSVCAEVFPTVRSLRRHKLQEHK